MFRVDLTAWYWTPDGELRECIVTSVDGTPSVIDAETLEELDVPPENVLLERPET